MVVILLRSPKVRAYGSAVVIRQSVWLPTEPSNAQIRSDLRQRDVPQV